MHRLTIQAYMCLATLFLCVCMYGILRCAHVETILLLAVHMIPVKLSNTTFKYLPRKILFCVSNTTTALKYLMASAELPAMLRNILTRFLNRKEPRENHC